MKEYRIVATLDTEHVYNGQKFHYDVASCWYHGRPHKMQTIHKDKAEEYLKQAKKECPKFDKETQERTGKDNIKYWQTNIRIQTRDISDWKD